MSETSLQKKAKRLRIYIGEQDRWRGSSLEMALLQTLRSNDIAGATVFRGIAGYGAHSVIRTVRLEVFSADLPVVIEAVDTEEHLASVLTHIYPMVREGLITLEDVEIVKYTHRFLNPLPADKLVSEVMTRDVVALQPGMTIREAWKTLFQQRVKAAPVIDAWRRVVGIVTDEDLLERAELKQRLSVALRMDTEELEKEMRYLDDLHLTVQAVMTQPVVTVREDDSLGSAAARMVKHGLKRLPVTRQDGTLAGVLSRLDILKQVADAPHDAVPANPPLKMIRTAADVMSTAVPTVRQDDNLSAVIEQFLHSGSHRLIVVDEQGKAVGLISDADVVARVEPSNRRGILNALRNLGKPPAGRETAGSLMSAGVLAVSPELPVLEALKTMLESARKWMVVADEAGRPLGLIDRQIMLEAVAVFPDKNP
ncbi:MAG: DUF190 domain-containing protein [Anaerolineaceae bacterium]